MPPIPPLPSTQESLQQVSELLGLPAIVALYACLVLVVALRDWRLVVAAFMGLSILQAVIAATIIPSEWALLRVIVGGMIAIMWYLSAQRAGWGGRFLPFRPSGGVQARPLSSTTIFRLLLSLALALTLVVTRPRLPLPDLPSDVRLAATWLIAFALLGLAMGEEALQTGVALLLALAATHLVMDALQPRAELIWLLSSVELLVGLATAYLMVARGSAVSAQSNEEGA